VIEMSESTMERIKRWAKGLLVLVFAWLGSDEFPLGQYDAKPVEPDQTEDGEPGSARHPRSRAI
jgi:hypothetical protein